MLQIPKNVMQIGQIGAHTKIYMEDYVHTFVERIRDSETYLVFGKKDEHSDVTIYLIYGVEKKSDWDRGSYPYFKKYDRIGTLEGPYGQKIFKPIRGTGIALTGYFIFYEQNEDMQSYMIASKEAEAENRSEEKEKVIEEVANRLQARRQEQLATEMNKPIQREKMRKKLLKTSFGHRKLRVFKPRVREKQKTVRVWTVPEICRLGSLALLLVLAVSAVTSVNRYPDMKSVMNIFTTAADNLRSRRDSESETDQASIVIEENKSTAGEEITALITSESLGDDETEVQTEMAQVQEETEIVLDISEETVVDTITDSESDAVPANAAPDSYIVKKGDNLAQIIRNHYGSTARLWEICELNGIKNPDQILPGQNILLP